MDGMIVKFEEEELHENHLTIMFNCVCRLNMRLNPEKCIFGFKENKFLEFCLTKRSVE